MHTANQETNDKNKKTEEKLRDTAELLPSILSAVSGNIHLRPGVVAHTGEAEVEGLRI